MIETADFVIVGAGIVGLALARELRLRHPAARIIVLEKEDAVGKHASGRNSGVLHAGLYYAESSLKAKVCASGARAMGEYCEERKLPLRRLGKVVLPVRADDDAMLDTLFKRGTANGAEVAIIDAARLAELEPAARSLTGRALHSPRTAVIDPKAVLSHLAGELQQQGVELRTGQRVTAYAAGQLVANGGAIAFGQLFNAAGLYADVVAKACGLGERYAMLPFKGLYRELAPDAPLKVNGLIYPVPDMQVPFLGVHFTPSLGGHVYVGPTAVPAFGREQYRGLESVKPGEAAAILLRLAGQYWGDRQGFRGFAHAEALRFLPARFIEAARALVPAIASKHLIACPKVGIRAQLLDLQKRELVMDFLVEHAPQSTHVLNAVSPGFTSAFAFAPLVIDGAGC